jgi:hypothetical protein
MEEDVRFGSGVLRYGAAWRGLDPRTGGEQIDGAVRAMFGEYQRGTVRIGRRPKPWRPTEGVRGYGHLAATIQQGKLALYALAGGVGMVTATFSVELDQSVPGVAQVVTIESGEMVPDSEERFDPIRRLWLSEAKERPKRSHAIWAFNRSGQPRVGGLDGSWGFVLDDPERCRPYELNVSRPQDDDGPWRVTLELIVMPGERISAATGRTVQLNATSASRDGLPAVRWVNPTTAVLREEAALTIAQLPGVFASDREAFAAGVDLLPLSETLAAAGAQPASGLP